jgi:xanthine dehydrogenase small subunit
MTPSPRLRGEGGGEGEFLRAYKISKRYDDDISAVCLVVAMHLRDGVVESIGIGAGGVAATPVRAVQAEASLRGQAWTADAAQRAAAALRSEFQPITDMRASAAYRAEVLGNLMQRFWLESQGLQQINLESFRLAEATFA